MAKQENKEVIILSDDDIKTLPAPVKKEVNYLTNHINASDLVLLNPLIKELIDIKALVEEINIIEPEGDEEFDKENIEEYKSIKSKIRAYNGNHGREFKTIKAPYTKISKSLVVVDKGLKSVSDALSESLQSKFQKYEDAEQKKKEEKERKKNEALINAVDEAKNENEELKQKGKVSEIYNTIKYTNINDGILTKTTNHVNHSNEETLSKWKEELTGIKWMNVIDGLEAGLLESDMFGELLNYFNSTKNNCIELIDKRLKQFETDKENIVLSSQSPVNKLEVVAEEIDAKMPAEVPLPPNETRDIQFNEELTDYEFIKRMAEHLDGYRKMVNSRIQTKLSKNEQVDQKLFVLQNIFIMLDNIK